MTYAWIEEALSPFRGDDDDTIPAFLTVQRERQIPFQNLHPFDSPLQRIEIRSGLLNHIVHNEQRLSCRLRCSVTDPNGYARQAVGRTPKCDLSRSTFDRRHSFR